MRNQPQWTRTIQANDASTVMLQTRKGGIVRSSCSPVETDWLVRIVSRHGSVRIVTHRSRAEAELTFAAACKEAAK